MGQQDVSHITQLHNMKTLKLKKLNEFDYKTNLLGILQNAPANGLTVDDVRKAVKAIDVVKDAKDEASFEDEIGEYVKKRVEESKFVVASSELVEFLDDIGKL